MNRADTAQPLRPHRRCRERRRPARFSRILGEILVTAGVLALLFAFYEAFWSNLDAARRQAEARQELAQHWESRTEPAADAPLPAPDPAPGEAFAAMYIPALGPDYHYAVVEGTGETELRTGPGHYPETQLPGQPGNFAVAGHRIGKGAPFNDLGQLQVCDAIVVETQTSWETYRILPVDESGSGRRTAAAECFTPEQTEEIATGRYGAVAGRHITVPEDIGVIAPVPGDTVSAGEEPDALLTLTTCHPEFSNTERMIVHAMLVDSALKDHGSAARPAVLEEN